MSKRNIPSDSIISKEWEYIDPTPDIHVLFIQFNHRFFEGQLEGVEVKWSPRMTLCAGVCSYEGRGGLCSVRLSAPLLKLRPRKDLVETLLHEMIHAYLFVTQRNRDRDGHGPEFQKHMHRINKECGCNITIYHSFHEEVNLYRQHVWRCDGPCRFQKPFYGLVRRSMNRAPGPTDNWWSQHQASCNGKFGKIQEPDNYVQKKSKKIAIEDSKDGDIRKFVFPGKGNIANGNRQVKKPSTSTAGTSRQVNSGNLNTSVNTINNTNSSTKINVTGNVRSFSEIGAGSSQPVAPPGNNRGRGDPRGRGGGLRGATSNRGGKTLVISGSKTNKKEETATSSTEVSSNFIPFQGKGFVLGRPSTIPTNTKTVVPKQKVQQPNNQVKIFDSKSFSEPSTSKDIENSSTSKNNNSNINPFKKLKSDDTETPKITKWYSPTKKQNASTTNILNESDGVIIVEESPLVHCPVCNCSLSVEAVNKHLDECLSQLPLQETSANVIVIDEDDEEVKDEEENLVKCPLCDGYYPSEKMESHVNACVETLHDAFEADAKIEENVENAQQSEPPQESGEDAVSCPVCQANIKAENINQHLDTCLSESVIKSDSFN